jgi:hypothetical protein
MISTTFQLGSNGSYVEKFLVGSGNTTDEEDFIKSVILAIETLGDLNIDYDWENETNTTVPVPSSVSPSPNPSTVVILVPSIENVPAPMPSNPEVPPEPVMNPEPGMAPINQEPAPSSEEPAPSSQEPAPSSEEPTPSSQNPDVVPEPMPSGVINLSGEKRANALPPLNNSTFPQINITISPEQVPAPSINNSTLNATTNFTSQWVHVYFTPKTFNVTIISNITDIYYINNGPCMPLMDYWKDVTLGCPCDSTWNNTGYYNSSSKCFEGGRQITPSQCPNNTCHETFFLNDTIIYANIRLNTTLFVENGTVANKTAELTKVSPFKEIGYAYGANDIIAVFMLSNETESLPSVPQTTYPDMNDTEIDSGSVSLPLTSIVTMLFSFLLILYENTQ